MQFYLLTVESSSQSGAQVQVLPRVPLQDLIKRSPAGMLMPVNGDKLELRLPNGDVRPAVIESFGVELWRGEDDRFYATSNPSDPVLTLTIAGGLRPEDVPPGTKIWLSEARYQTPAEEKEGDK